MREAFIRLTPAEVQSNYDRQKFAEGLIIQLPKSHDGRNTWLMNYGENLEAEALRNKRKLPFNEKFRAAASVT